VAHLQMTWFDPHGKCPPTGIGRLSSILDWSARTSRQPLGFALRSEIRELLTQNFPQLETLDFSIALLPTPTPVFDLDQDVGRVSIFQNPPIPIQSRSYRWGYLQINRGDALDSTEVVESVDSATLRLALRLIAERLDLALERERAGVVLNQMTHVAGAAVHEARNPLTSLRLQLHLLDRMLGEGPGPSRQLVADMECEIQRISSHLEDLSTVAQYHGGRFALNPARVDLVGAVRGVVTRHSRLFEIRKTTCSFSSSLSEIFGNMDAFRLEQVVGNLLSNAWKYGDSKPVEVSLEVVDSGAPQCLTRTCGSKSCCVIRVRDRGRGMDAEAASQVFEGFLRAEKTTHQPGTGLGLYVSLSVLKAMGGTLTVESKIGEGSEFIACIPRNL
jgi:signal transduction histidine kinase